MSALNPGALIDAAQKAVQLALEMGATAAEATASEGVEFSATVRMGDVETVKEAGSRAAGVRVLAGRHTGSSYTSDLSADGLRTMVRQAIELARITTEDPHAGLPEPSELGSNEGELSLYHEDAAALDTASKIEMARRAEKAALERDARISNSEGGSFGSGLSASAFANSHGFAGVYRSSSCSITAVPVARDGGGMQRDYWYSAARSLSALESPESVGRRAAERALRRLNPRKVETQKAAVIFEPQVARTLLGHIFEGVNGESIYRKASFLEGKLGERVAAENVTVIDDATIPGLFGTAPFDDEGVPSRRTVVIERGVLQNYLLNTYTARKLGLKTTGNASRGITGNAGVGHGNLYLENGSASMEDLLRTAGKGLYVTELLGFGVNVVTGDYSRGAAGLWFENGELAYPVAEVTIAANLKDMLLGIVGIGGDLEFRTSVASPTLMIGEMTISGH